MSTLLKSTLGSLFTCAALMIAGPTHNMAFSGSSDETRETFSLINRTNVDTYVISVREETGNEFNKGNSSACKITGNYTDCSTRQNDGNGTDVWGASTTDNRTGRTVGAVAATNNITGVSYQSTYDAGSNGLQRQINYDLNGNYFNGTYENSCYGDCW
ncbi:MAG: hypothetical protein K2X47_02010 [Bdellovibrionales bacterium]|nr:hypothetical protein [Bdellovibrionales bacterium]